MQREGRPDVDAIWVKPHLNRKGNMVKGHWRTRPRVVSVRGALPWVELREALQAPQAYASMSRQYVESVSCCGKTGQRRQPSVGILSY